MKLLQFGCVFIALALGGCSTGLLGGGSSAPTASNQQIQVNNQLALPPDLSLRAPGSQPSYDSTNLDAPAPAPAPRRVAATEPNLYGGAAPAPAPAVDVYEKYGINKFNADGTKKDDGKLRAELRAAVIAEKRKTNPNYGTIRNIGELFNDQ